MNTCFDLGLLKKETETLGTALFYNFSNALLKFPTSVVQLSKFDEDGNVWFQIQKPYNVINGMDRIFAAQLNFYKKGFSNYITVYGVATISAEETPGIITIKFKISSADRFCKNIKASSFFISLKSSVSYFFKSFYKDDPHHLHFCF